jgi:molybdopterin/thiamine biosynthesis adenylyltransferase/rhodanese-related sulfurtransferase
MDYADQVRRAKAAVTEVSAEDFIEGGSSYDIIIDVRERHEFAAGAIPGAHFIPLALLEDRLAEVAEPPDRVLLYCAVGARSAVGAQTAARLGYTNVSSLAGGYNLWKHYMTHGTGQPLSAAQRDRYARHLTLEEVGAAGQEKLLAGSVVIVGAGGLGSPAALYLAAAGVGRIGLVDADVVELSNLQRQIVHNVDRLGQPKATSAARTLDRLNPDCDIRVHDLRLAAANVLDIIGNYQVIIDATDNFPTRYLLNDATQHTGQPVVHGSIFRFEGQASVFQPFEGPCYRCLFPEPPPPELAPNCAEAGVLGVLPGIIGSLQATEAIKLILGVGESLIGRLLTYDALDQSMMTLRISRDPNCLTCGDGAGVPVIVDYDATCVPIRG